MILQGDCLDLLADMGPDSVDSVVCDPPYGLSPDGRARTWDDIEDGKARGGFMGKGWDSACPGVTWAREVLRVVKPGGHLVAFGGQRTIHRLACALEDAGWQIRDQIGWAFWSGFPKSLDVSKAIDRLHGAEREVVGYHSNTMPQISPRQNFGHRYGDEGGNNAITAPATPDAQRWSGYGTAIKPAIEPCILARKPLRESSIARQVLKTGTGALNIDGCRYGYGDLAWPGPQEKDDTRRPSSGGDNGLSGTSTFKIRERRVEDFPLQSGRFPANIYATAKASRSERERGCSGLPARTGAEATGRTAGSAGLDNPRSGAQWAAGVQNHHPTVKPVRLMRWLVRLVTPPNGVVLDTFLGSGSTGIAATLEGFDWIGMEREPEYVAIAEARTAHAKAYPGVWADTAPGADKEQKAQSETAAEREALEKAGQTGMFTK